MLQMKNILNKTLIAAVVVSMAACTGNYEEINSEPYTPGDLTADDYALGSALNNIAGSVVSAEVNKAQFTDCLLGGSARRIFFSGQARMGQFHPDV